MEMPKQLTCGIKGGSITDGQVYEVWLILVWIRGTTLGRCGKLCDLRVSTIGAVLSNEGKKKIGQPGVGPPIT